MTRDRDLQRKLAESRCILTRRFGTLTGLAMTGGGSEICGQQRSTPHSTARRVAEQLFSGQMTIRTKGRIFASENLLAFVQIFMLTYRSFFTKFFTTHSLIYVDPSSIYIDHMHSS